MGDVDGSLDALGARLMERVDELADAMADRIRAGVALYRTDMVPAAELRRACLENLTLVFGAIGHTEPTESRPSREHGRRRARDGVPLTAMMEAYRVGARFVWEQVAQAAAAEAVPTGVALRAATRMWLAQDVYTHDMAEGYRDEATAQLVDREQERSALVQALLDGELADSNLWEAADLLRLPSRGPYVVIAARAATVGRRALPHAERRLSALGIPSAWRLQHGVELGLAALTAAAPVDKLVDALSDMPAAGVGVSTPYARLQDTAAALRLARIALNSTLPDQRVSVFGRDPLATAAATAPDVLEQVADQVLASLAKIPAADRASLLDTFGTWLDAGGSSADAAARLFVHPNTVRHRLRRLQERTGRSLTHPRDVAELTMAYEVDRRRTTD
ncbi:PucR family transcriptional regulator [Asanoa iriomotensis]|uniref:PucR family transcriptional regulator n=1 Tax=Asanoa iriomotensis TaxID=234613 RepID=UPI00194524C1|nr:helix-turn-helix domain-containing protein [Asanoa iriomotensis]